ncbi:LysE family translocator [Microvirga terrestris]|uniref:LysE family translocator n=1 Tax=Microvirga terrestris TaxID=2791024 RepID=A0ABS0HTH7_9HYPH|nr:LysE family translocator [Microvirga terrestris]MBF9196689.1 LysE family translocator [Microvirga terrestris]
MSYTENLWVFFALLLGIIIVPGMDMMFVLANALADGRRGGMAATAGIILGGVFHTAFGVLGVGVVLQFAPSVFAVLIVAGAAYMAWIGFSLARSSLTVDLDGPALRRSPWVAFRQGAVTSVINPKAYMFTLSVFPQFIAPRYGSLWWQGLVLGILVLLAQFSVYGGLALLAGRSRDALLSNPRVTVAITRAVGILLVLVAALTAWQGWRNTMAVHP